MAAFTATVERIVAGLEKRNWLFNPRERQVVAYHEMGHASPAAWLCATAWRRALPRSSTKKSERVFLNDVEALRRGPRNFGESAADGVDNAVRIIEAKMLEKVENALRTRREGLERGTQASCLNALPEGGGCGEIDERQSDGGQLGDYIGLDCPAVVDGQGKSASWLQARTNDTGCPPALARRGAISVDP